MLTQVIQQYLSIFVHVNEKADHIFSPKKNDSSFNNKEITQYELALVKHITY